MQATRAGGMQQQECTDRNAGHPGKLDGSDRPVLNAEHDRHSSGPRDVNAQGKCQRLHLIAAKFP